MFLSDERSRTWARRGYTALALEAAYSGVLGSKNTRLTMTTRIVEAGITYASCKSLFLSI